ncbi:MAG: dienelactone hydrolase family protein [Trueperaceae bacterium]
MNGPHSGAIAASAGAPLAASGAAMVMIHGRGDSAAGILSLAEVFDRPDIAYVAPQATHNTWYPNSFLVSLADNEPWLGSALEAMGAVVDAVAAAGMARERIVLLGFSQGACLASEYAARNAARFGAVVALSGGLIGPDGTTRDYGGSLQGTPVFLGCSDVDAHIPVARVHETADVLAAMGASVEKRIYPNFGHTVNQDEVDWVKGLLSELLQDSRHLER